MGPTVCGCRGTEVYDLMPAREIMVHYNKYIADGRSLPEGLYALIREVRCNGNACSQTGRPERRPVRY